jgi:Transposase
VVVVLVELASFETAAAGTMMVRVELDPIGDSLRSFLKQQRTAPTVPCTLESTGAYHLLVALSLNEAGYRVNCVNPIITKKYMKATVRDAKSDKLDSKRIAELAYHEPDLQRFVATREDIAAKSVLSALAQLETLRQQLSAHIAHTKEMRHTLGVVIDCKEATKSLENIKKQIEAHRTRLCELAPKEARVLASNVKGLSLEQAVCSPDRAPRQILQEPRSTGRVCRPRCTSAAERQMDRPSDTLETRQWVFAQGSVPDRLVAVYAQ